jgi:hypothetical protein
MAERPVDALIWLKAFSVRRAIQNLGLSRVCVQKDAWREGYREPGPYYVTVTASGRPMNCSVRNFIYRCPIVRLNVQGSAAAGDGDEGRKYVGQRCLACGGLHLVNPESGKLLAEEIASRALNEKD